MNDMAPSALIAIWRWHRPDRHAQPGTHRTEADFAAHIKETISTDPEASWTSLPINSYTHRRKLVCLVAQLCDIQEDLGGRTRKSGHPASMKTRAAFLSDPTHRIRLVYTPGIVPG